MNVLIWTIMAFFLGAIPFSVWLGRYSLGVDIRHFGDGNPGATNAFRAGGWKLGLPALLLDFLKGAIPVGLAHFVLDIYGWGLLPVALAPLVGHAFSPFLGFKGGKALAATFGIWTGLTLAWGPTSLGLLMAQYLLLQDNHDWATILAMVTFPLVLWWQQANLILVAIWAGNLLIMLWRYYPDLGSAPSLRPWLLKLTRRTS